MPKKENKNSYTVQAGDSWAKIAGKLYNNQRMFKELMAANPQLKYLRPGQKINLALPKRNEDIFISNDAAQAMGMATSGEVADFYSQNADAQKYGMTNILRANQQAAWNTGQTFDTAAPAATQWWQRTPSQGPVGMPQPGLYPRPTFTRAAENAPSPLAAQYAPNANGPATDSRYRRYDPNRKELPGADPRQPYQYSATNQVTGFLDRARELFGMGGNNRPPRNQPGGVGPQSPFANTLDPLGPQSPQFQAQRSTAQQPPSWFQFGQGPLGPSLGLSPAGLVAGAQAAGAASVAMGGQPPAGAAVTGRQTQQPAQPQAPVDPVKAAVQKIESGSATDWDYATVAAAKLLSGQMTPQDWQYLAKFWTQDEYRTALSVYNKTYQLGGGSTPSMDISTGGIGNPAGVPAMVGNVFVGPNFDRNKLRGYFNPNGTFVAANLAGSYFAPLKPNELAGYRSQRNAGNFQQQGGYTGSGLSYGLYTWRV